MSPNDIASLIDNSPMNRGMIGDVWLSEDGNVAIEKGGNVFLFERVLPAIYEFHWLHTEDAGKPAVETTLAAFDEIFSQHPDCEAIFGLVSSRRLDVRVMANAIGAKKIGVVDTPEGFCEIFIVTREMRNVFS